MAATAAGVLIAACAGVAAFFPTWSHADEVPPDGYALACPSEALLQRLLIGEFTEANRVCSLVLFVEVELNIPVRDVFGDTYDAWFAHLVDDPSQTLPEVHLSMMKIAGLRAYAAWPLSFVDEHWLDEDAMAQNAITFGLQFEAFDSWEPALPGYFGDPVMVASTQ